MSTKRHGNRVVSDLSKAILFIIKRGASSTDEVVDLLGNSYEDQRVRRRIYSLKDNDFLSVKPNQELEITNKGIAALQNLKLKTVNDSKLWDKRWRLVIYDIPEDKHAARDKIRYLLKDLGFQQLQLSAWVHPLPCLDQFQAIREAYGIHAHLFLFEIKDSSEFDSLRKKFAKQYPRAKITL